MSLKPGTRLGPYAIERAIGAGGMGEVYEAVDTRLDRTVAIKVLPEHVAGDPELRQRFDREARAISSLNHPHICTLHDVGTQDGVDFLVMEYLEGETLAQRLAKGALPLDQALQIGIQIADALDKAHRQGIVHRDLKPGNIFLVGAAGRRSGTSGPPIAKLLDFGLAKLRPAAPAGIAAVSAAPTLSSALTGAGSIVGTFQYMAPEQLEGQEADARTDIFAFGAVLYEMLTGRRAFGGKSQASLIAAILRGEPAAPSTVQPVTPAAVDRIVTTCLAKDPDDRWQTARDLLRELKWIESGGGAAQMASHADQRGGQRNTRLREQLAWAVSGISLLAAVGFGSARYLDVDDTPARPQTLSILLPETAIVQDNARTIALSPDGTMLAFVLASQRTTMLWIRSFDSPDARPLPGTEGATFPFWAPDSRTIGFASLGRLRKVQLSGTPPDTIGNVPILTGATWNRDDVIVFSNGINGMLYRVSANGGEATPVTVLDETREETGHVLPSFLPDGRHFLYFARSQGGGEEGINIGSLDSPKGTRLLSADSGALYAPPASGGPGHLLFVRANALLAQPFDAERLQLTGEALAIGAGQVLSRGATRQAPFSSSDTGTLAYVTGNPGTRLAWFDRGGGRYETLDLPPGSYDDVQLSPDTTRVATRRRLQGGSNEIWLFDLRSGTSTPLTLGDGDSNPRWSPDGRSLVFLKRGRGDSNEVVRKPADGTEAEEVLARHEDQMVPSDWSPDGRALVLRRVPSGALGGLWVLPLSRGNREPWAVAQADVRGLNGRFSPDGRWLAYTAEATGQAEVYVQSFPEADRRILVSRGGGLRPLWRRDGRELFFTADHPTSGVRTLFSVTVEPTAETLRIGAPAPMMEVPFGPGSTNHYQYAVTPDGQRFLMIVPVEDRPTSAVTIVLNWATALPRP